MAIYEPCPISCARWITSSDRAALESFKSDQQSSLAYDADDCLTILSSSEWKLSRIIEEWPQITFHTTREIR
jgi:Peptide chain release factor RF-3